MPPFSFSFFVLLVVLVMASIFLQICAKKVAFLSILALVNFRSWSCVSLIIYFMQWMSTDNSEIAKKKGSLWKIGDEQVEVMSCSRQCFGPHTFPSIFQKTRGVVEIKSCFDWINLNLTILCYFQTQFEVFAAKKWAKNQALSPEPIRHDNRPKTASETWLLVQEW